jgi:hypothetical protein
MLKSVQGGSLELLRPYRLHGCYADTFLRQVLQHPETKGSDRNKGFQAVYDAERSPVAAYALVLLLDVEKRGYRNPCT